MTEDKVPIFRLSFQGSDAGQRRRPPSVTWPGSGGGGRRPNDFHELNVVVVGHCRAPRTLVAVANRIVRSGPDLKIAKIEKK